MAAAARDAALAEARAKLEECRAALAERDTSIEQRDDRIAELDSLANHLSRLVIARERELDELRDQIDTLLVQARGYATRVRMQALRQAASIEGARGGEETDAGDQLQSTFGLRPAAPLDLFEGVVQLEIGPLEDFSQLVGFEDAAAGINAASQISVTRFSKGRATLDLRLAEPTDLLRELAHRSPVGFQVRSLRDGRLILDLEDGDRAA